MKPGLTLEQWSNFIAGVSQTREAEWARVVGAQALKSGRTFGSRHHNYLLHDPRPSNLIFLNLDLLNCKTGSIISPGLFWKVNVVMNTRSEHNVWPKGRAAVLFSFLSSVMSSSLLSQWDRTVEWKRSRLTKVPLLYSWSFKTFLNCISNRGPLRSPRYYLFCKIHVWRNEVTIKALVKLKSILRMQDDDLLLLYMLFWLMLYVSLIWLTWPWLSNQSVHKKHQGALKTQFLGPSPQRFCFSRSGWVKLHF